VLEQADEQLLPEVRRLMPTVARRSRRVGGRAAAAVQAATSRSGEAGQRAALAVLAAEGVAASPLAARRRTAWCLRRGGQLHDSWRRGGSRRGGWR